MSFAATIQGVPLARAFTTSSLSKPRSAQSARRAPLIVRAKDPAAPDKAEVKGEVVDCEFSLADLLLVRCLIAMHALPRVSYQLCEYQTCSVATKAWNSASELCAVAVANELPGISQPFPNIFDPLNFLGSAGSSNNPIRDVRRWRESELTHGRVCMLAALGFVAQEQLINTPNRPFPFVKGKRHMLHHLFVCGRLDFFRSKPAVASRAADDPKGPIPCITALLERCHGFPVQTCNSSRMALSPEQLHFCLHHAYFGKHSPNSTGMQAQPSTTSSRLSLRELSSGCHFC